MISEDLRARIRRLFFAEHWKIGTIATELGLHRDTVALAGEASRFATARFQSRAMLLDPYRDFVRQTRFERLGVFPYSLEPGTPAERLPDHLPEEVKAARRDEIMEIQQQVAFAHAQAQVGRETEMIVDGPDPEVPGHVLARTVADAPDIDCVVRLKGKNLQPGDLVRARITGADGYDLMARAIRVR